MSFFYDMHSIYVERTILQFQIMYISHFLMFILCFHFHIYYYTIHGHLVYNIKLPFNAFWTQLSYMCSLTKIDWDGISFWWLHVHFLHRNMFTMRGIISVSILVYHRDMDSTDFHFSLTQFLFWVSFYILAENIISGQFGYSHFGLDTVSSEASFPAV